MLSSVIQSRALWRWTIEVEAAFDALFSRYAQPVCAYLGRVTGDNGQAQELTQETFLRAYHSLLRGEVWENPRAWLYRTASRLAIDAYRRQRLLRWLPLSSQAAASRMAAAAPGTEAAALDHIAVRAALDTLPLTYRLPLLLYTCEGYSVAEVAGMLRLSISAVKMRLCRAREMFRQAYGPEEEP